MTIPMTASLMTPARPLRAGASRAARASPRLRGAAGRPPGGRLGGDAVHGLPSQGGPEGQGCLHDGLGTQHGWPVEDVLQQLGAPDHHDAAVQAYGFLVLGGEADQAGDDVRGQGEDQGQQRLPCGLDSLHLLGLAVAVAAQAPVGVGVDGA